MNQTNLNIVIIDLHSVLTWQSFDIHKNSTLEEKCVIYEPVSQNTHLFIEHFIIQKLLELPTHLWVCGNDNNFIINDFHDSKILSANNLVTHQLNSKKMWSVPRNATKFFGTVHNCTMLIGTFMRWDYDPSFSNI